MQDSYPYQQQAQQPPYQQPAQQPPYQQPVQAPQKPNAPGAVASLVLGIISLVTMCSGIVSLICGIIGLVMGNKARAAANANPGYYKGAGLYNTGRGLSIAGIVIGSIMLVWILIALIIGGSLPWDEILDF